MSRFIHLYFATLICCIILLSAKQSSGQELWSNCLQKKEVLYTTDMAVDTMGNSYITGNYYDSITGRQKFFISKTNKNGEQKWIRYYPGSKADTSEVGTVITVDNNGNVIAAGYRYNNYLFSCTTTVTSQTSVFAVSYDINGKLLWVNNSAIGQVNTQQEPADIKADKKNNIYILNNIIDHGGFQGLCDYYSSALYKISEIGNTIFHLKQFPPGLEGRAISVDGKDNLVLTGFIHPPKILKQSGDYYNQVYIQKINPVTGVMIWERGFPNLNAAGISDPYALSCDNRNNIYVYGKVNDTAAVLCYSPSGKLLDVKKAPDGSRAIASRRGLSIDNNGIVNIVAYKYASSKYRWVTGSFTTAGTVRWSAPYQLAENDYGLPVAIKTDKQGNVFVSGNSKYKNLSSFTTIKYNVAGAKQWINFYNTAPGNSFANAMEMDAAGNAYVSGNSNSFDACTIKLSGNFICNATEIAVNIPVKKVSVPLLLREYY